jgi:ArsR family transcriptional regulator
MRKALLITAIVLLVASGAASVPLAQHEERPPQTMFPEVSTAEVKKMVDEHINFVLVDTRSKAEYAEGHIKGAINIQPSMLQYISGLLPRNKSIPVIFYCRGYG